MTVEHSLAAGAGALQAEPTGLLRRLIERSRDQVAVVDERYLLLAFNRPFEDEFLRVYGREVQRGDSLLDLLRPWPQDRIQAEAALSRALRGEEHAAVIEAGNPLLGRASYEASYGPLEAEGLRGAYRITRRMDGLDVGSVPAESDTRLRMLADSLPVIVWTRDAQGRIEFVNRHWSEFSGLTQDQSETAWARVVHPDDLPALIEGLRQSRVQGVDFRVEYRFRHAATGTYRWHIARIVPGRDDEGRIVRWIGTAMDIEEQVQTRAKLEQVRAELQRANHDLALSLTQLEAVIGNMSEGLVLCEASGRILVMNRMARRLYGLPDDAEASRHPPSSVRDLAGNSLPEALGPLSRVLNGESFADEEYRVHRQDDGREWIASYGGSPIRGAQGQLLFAVLTFRDVTQQHEAQRALELAVETRDRFLSIASHELRTPLTTLTMQLQMARRRVDPAIGRSPTPSDLARILDTSNRQLQRLGRLVDDLLDVSRIQAGKLEFDFQPVDLGRLVEEVCRQFAPQLDADQCSLRLNLASGIVGHWDQGRLEQVLGNLLTNAIKYAPATPIEISLWVDGDFACLRIRDHGPGVDPEHHARIFERFERCNNDRCVGGLGLGLFLVRQIVRGHGGEITLDNAPVTGACFTIRLPLRTAQNTDKS